jgi:hypothetical protein
MVTFSRGGYLAFAVSILFYLIFELIKKFDDLKIKRLLTISVVITMVIFSAIPVVFGNFAQSRLSSIEHDFNTRLEHWKETINMVDNNWISQSFGMGVGKFPIIYYLTSLEESRSGYYSVINDDGQSYIRLGVGKGLYIDQAITSPLIMPLTVKFKVRVTAGKGQIGFSVCQKWLLASANCNWQTSLINQTNKWLDQQVTLDQNQIGISTEFSLVPYFFSFTNTSQAMIDISEIRLVNHQGENLLSNGSFQDGMDHWFFQADQHLPWHVKNLFLAIYFDQGLFGFIVFVALLILAVIWAIRTRQEDWALALVAFIFVGFFDSLIDSPRFFLLLMILLSFPFLFKPSIVIK